MTNKQLSFEELLKIINSRIASKDEKSYNYQLALGGVSKISRKIGEEATEVIIAAFENNKLQSEKTHQELVGEICDLFYHNLVLMASQNIKLEEILEEFARRNDKHK